MKSKLPYQPFVILGTARTGSTLLWSYLNSHPDILCLRGVYGSTNKINFGKFYSELPEEYFSQELISLRNEKPIDFLQQYVFKNYSKLFKAVGFKFFYDHNRHLKNKNELTDYFTNTADIRFIHLKRKNLLETLFSYKRALASNQWTSDNHKFKTEISIEECEDFFKNILQQQKQFDNLYSDRTIQISYDSLTSQPERVLSEIQKFIGVEEKLLKTETASNKKVILMDTITNYQELKKYFSNTEYANYFTE